MAASCVGFGHGPVSFAASSFCFGINEKGRAGGLPAMMPQGEFRAGTATASGVRFFHMTGVDSQEVADRAVFEDCRCQGYEPYQAEIAKRSLEDEEEGQQRHSDNGTNDAFGF
jgi:hypothetical protein